MSSISTVSASNLEDVTYELFDIDPQQFYEERFALGENAANSLEHPVHRYEISFEKIRRLVADLQQLLPSGGNVLDIGCGSGTYGPTLLANVPGLVLHGVDMSQTCLNQAQKNGYTSTNTFDLNSPLPYDDEQFDAIISMDLFGHIEFRYKDRMIAELARVTRRGGFGHHGAETATIDYLGCNPKDPDDPVRKYVYIEGHVGIEPCQALCDRLSVHFDEVRPHLTFLHPFHSILDFVKYFELDFRELVASHQHPEAIQLSLVLLGRLNRYFVDLYQETFGEAFQPNDRPQSPKSAEHQQSHDNLMKQIEEHNQRFGQDFVPTPRELFRAAGFSSITVHKHTV